MIYQIITSEQHEKTLAIFDINEPFDPKQALKDWAAKELGSREPEPILDEDKLVVTNIEDIAKYREKKHQLSIERFIGYLLKEYKPNYYSFKTIDMSKYND